MFDLGFVWRRGRDSNPCGVSPKRFSRPPRYDRFDTSPFVSLPWAGRASNGCAKVFSNHSPEKTDVSFCPCGASAGKAKRRARHSPCDESIITTETDVVNYFGKQAQPAIRRKAASFWPLYRINACATFDIFTVLSQRTEPKLLSITAFAHIFPFDSKHACRRILYCRRQILFLSDVVKFRNGTTRLSEFALLHCKICVSSAQCPRHTPLPLYRQRLPRSYHRSFRTPPAVRFAQRKRRKRCGVMKTVTFFCIR